VETEFLSALLTYINSYSGRGTVVIIKIDKICGLNRRCSWYIYKYMSILERKKLVVKWKKGMWIAEKKNLNEIRSSIVVLLPRRDNKNIYNKR
jgi:hypothetical protein